jgi:ABC-type transport system involved in cytochrome c biogenesis permease subunit
MSKSLSLLSWLLVALVAVACSRAAPLLQGELERRANWSPEFVQQVGALPLQNDGRMLPFSTLAAFTLYAAHGRRDVEYTVADPAGSHKVKLSPTEWLLDVWFYPAQAARYPLFRIENVGVLSALGLEHGGQRQDFEYLTYDQVIPLGEKLEQLAEQYDRKPAKLRSGIEAQIVQLFGQVASYHRLHTLLSPMQGEIAIEGDELRKLFDGRDRVGLAAFLQRAEAFRAYVRTVGEKFEDPRHGNLAAVLTYLSEASRTTRGPRLLPPLQSAKDDRWLTIAEVVDLAMRGGGDPAHIAMLGHLQSALLAKDLPATEQHLGDYVRSVVAASSADGAAETVALESYYYRANWHFHAMMTFLAGFLIAVVCWLLPRNRLLWWGSFAISTAAVAMLTADIWMRCLITGYGPIQRLYDTFLFIAGGGALVLLIAEWVLPRRVALALGPLFGVMLILFARLFEVADGQDTMKPLPAVLLSNFWLAVHVPTINLGYLSALAASALACAWVVVRVLRIDHPASSLAKALVRATYGVTCFSLATSGRFWGWDPKENGALLICLSQIALLHARMSGMVRDFGFVLWSLATGMVVVFSWFHTNLLGVGLHAYGFSSALLSAVWTSYTVLGLTMLAGTIDVLLRPNPAARARPAADALVTD